MAKPKVTKTMGPIHFEDLDPHRFEDLVRELVYDFKDWQSIEATGRGGADDGFDIRAYEAVGKGSTNAETDEDGEAAQPMDGNLWMVQCKRERELGPKKVAEIIESGVDAKNPPYGYILAASANFSKAAYDTFREKLRERGVMEFYLWGKAELEDMLHQPKNDHILFTFFGFSLVSRRRSRATEIRSVVIAKNKLFKILGEEPRHKAILFRDSKDTNYPYEQKYADFKDRPRWKEYPARSFHATGVIARVREHFAYVDLAKKEWDMTEALNLLSRESDDDETRRLNHDLREQIAGFWDFLPLENQATYVRNGLVRFDSMVVIDGEGDSDFKMPHIYVDFQGNRGPFDGFWQFIKHGNRERVYPEDLKRARIFPATFSKPQIGKIYKDKTIVFDDQTLHFFKSAGEVNSYHYCDGKYDFLAPRDAIPVAKSEEHGGGSSWIQITHRRQVKGKVLLDAAARDRVGPSGIERQIGRPLNPSDDIGILEFKKIYKWALEEK